MKLLLASILCISFGAFGYVARTGASSEGATGTDPAASTQPAADCLGEPPFVSWARTAPDGSMFSFSMYRKTDGSPLFFQTQIASVNHIGFIEFMTLLYPPAVLEGDSGAVLSFPGDSFTLAVSPLPGDWGLVGSPADVSGEFTPR